MPAALPLAAISAPVSTAADNPTAAASSTSPASVDPTRSLKEILHRPDIWRGFRSDSIGNQRTGYSLLDRHLPGRGWPAAGMIELICPRPGIGELRLLLPTLINAVQCWVAPPYPLYAPALSQSGVDLHRLLIIQPETPQDQLWALEQVLHAGSEDVVLGWCAQASMTDLRRLQLAAETRQTRLFLFRPPAVLNQPSPARLRLYLDAVDEGLHLRILKARGGQPAAFVLPLADRQPRQQATHHRVRTTGREAHAVAEPGSATTASARPRPRVA